MTTSDTPVPAGRNTPAARAYTNDRRAGKTHPDRRELIDPFDRRHRSVAGLSPAGAKPNRAARRSYGRGTPISTSPRSPRGLHPLSKRVLDLRARARELDELVEHANAVGGSGRIMASRADAIRELADGLVDGTRR